MGYEGFLERVVGAPRGTQGVRWGVPDDPRGGPTAKSMKNQWFFKVFEGVLEGPWEAKVRIALTLKRFGG